MRAITLVRMTDRTPAFAPTPPMSWVCGCCPTCGGSVVYNEYWLRGQAVGLYECWSGLDQPAACDFRRTLDGREVTL